MNQASLVRLRVSRLPVIHKKTLREKFIGPAARLCRVVSLAWLDCTDRLEVMGRSRPQKCVPQVLYLSMYTSEESRPRKGCKRRSAKIGSKGLSKPPKWPFQASQRLPSFQIHSIDKRPFRPWTLIPLRVMLLCCDRDRSRGDGRICRVVALA